MDSDSGSDDLQTGRPDSAVSEAWGALLPPASSGPAYVRRGPTDLSGRPTVNKSDLK